MKTGIPRPGAIDAAVETSAERAFELLERLVASPSTLGHEAPAQALVSQELRRLGFEVSSISIPDSIGDQPTSGVPPCSYDGRADVVGRIRNGSGPSLLLNSHIDVVPPSEPELWASAPFDPVRKDGWLHGRGAGDMKGGFVMASLAIEALTAVAPDAIAGELSFLSVIEEECTGNGTLAACLQGVSADAVLLPEPTNLDLLLAGVGIQWLEIDVLGDAAHAEAADRAVNPIESAGLVIDALRSLEREMNVEIEPSMRSVAHPYNVNIGTFHAGDWPSSVPARTRLGVRIGHPSAWTAEEAERRVRDVITTASTDPRLADNPPTMRQTGFRAQGYALDPAHPLVTALGQAHADAHGSPPFTVAMGSTTDARYYLNQLDTPALCYGPRTRHIHGVDEAVELQSIVDGARTLARFFAAWFSSPPEKTNI